MRIDFEPIGRRVDVPAGASLLDGARLAGVNLVAICGGMGTCGACRVRLVAGALTPVSEDEQVQLTAAERETGLRLACQCAPLGDVRIEVPPQSLTTPQRTQVEGIEAETASDPVVIGVELEVPPPGAGDLRADSLRLREALAARGFAPLSLSPAALSGALERLRAENWAAKAVLEATPGSDRVVAVLPAGSRLYGLAVDIGTTKLAAYLVDLESGETIARVGGMNPQIAFGEDVVARIAYTNQAPAGRESLKSRLVDTLNGMLAELRQQAGAQPEQVLAAALVGNTAMHHLFAGLPVRQLGASPYVPAVSEALDLPAALTGLALHPGASAYLPPNIAGYVGGDHIAMLLATEAWRAPGVTLAMDIGTNTEISLIADGRIYACSCASGPAFEGAHIHAGMRAAQGAIERLQIRDGKITYQTIDQAAPVGLCGSGILDAVAEMLASGVVDRRGVLRRDQPGVREREGKAEFVLVPALKSGSGSEIVITRSDVNQIQLAKAAIRTGVTVLLATAGLDLRQIDTFLIAGAFGTYLDVENAVRIGMFPDLPRDRFRQVGNAAGTGARQLLLSRQKRAEADDLVDRVQYVELTTYPHFSELFVDAMYFPNPAG